MKFKLDFRKTIIINVKSYNHYKYTIRNENVNLGSVQFISNLISKDTKVGRRRYNLYLSKINGSILLISYRQRQ